MYTKWEKTLNRELSELSELKMGIYPQITQITQIGRETI